MDELYYWPGIQGRGEYVQLALVLRKHPRLMKLHDAVFERPRIQRYAGSGRRLAFNDDDLFRHYPELDG